MAEVPESRTILAIVDDLLVASRIREAAKRVGADVEAIGSTEEMIVRLDAQRVNLVVVDLAIPDLDLKVTAEAARVRGVSVVAFYPHVDVELRRSARRAGIEHVYARSRFLRETAGILGDRLEEGSRQ